MRKLYATIPDRNDKVRSALANLSVQLGVKPPTVTFWLNANAKYEPDDRSIWLPDVAHTEYIDPLCTGPCYWSAVVMHEFAHYLADEWTGESGHTPEMFAIQTALVLLLDLPLAEFEKHECNYKPLAFKRGRKMAGVSILADIKETYLG
jgi:hypothetical protein